MTDKWKKYASPDRIRDLVEGKSRDLWTPFVWDEPPQGFRFWYHATNELDDGRPLPDEAKTALQSMLAELEPKL